MNEKDKRKREEEERRKSEEEEIRKKEEDKRKREEELKEEDKRKREEEDKRKREEEDKRKREEKERKKNEEEERRKTEEKERRKEEEVLRAEGGEIFEGEEGGIREGEEEEMREGGEGEMCEGEEGEMYGYEEGEMCEGEEGEMCGAEECDIEGYYANANINDPERKRKEEEKRKKEEEEEEIIKNPQRGRKNILATLDKQKLKNIVLKFPKRTSTNLKDFIKNVKQETNNLKDEEKAYIVFYWISQNIEYDVKGFSDTSPKGTFNNGKSVCSGYSRLFKCLATSIGLDVICIDGYAKDIEYDIKEEISGTNHEWNIIKLDNVFYQIDSTWGAGYVNKDIYSKELKEFYFCPEPIEFFPSHFPNESKWQLIYPTLSKEEFSKRVSFNFIFYQLLKTDYIYYAIQLKKRDKIRFYKKRKFIGLSISQYDENGGYTKNCRSLVYKRKDYLDVVLILSLKENIL